MAPCYNCEQLRERVQLCKMLRSNEKIRSCLKGVRGSDCGPDCFSTRTARAIAVSSLMKPNGHVTAAFVYLSDSGPGFRREMFA